MTAYQVYFTLITFGALQPASITFAQLPWLLITIVVGILCGFVINVYLLRDPPPVRLLRTLSRALLIRICALIDVLRAGLESGQGDGRLPRRLRHQFFLVSEAASIIGQQFARMGSETLLAGVDKDELARRLFDAELAAEGLVVPAMAVGSGSLPQALRVQLTEMLGTLRRALCADTGIAYLQQVADEHDVLLGAGQLQPDGILPDNDAGPALRIAWSIQHRAVAHPAGGNGHRRRHRHPRGTAGAADPYR